MGSLTSEDTQVSYHRDNPFGEARPAVNVKVHGFDRETFNLIETAMGESFAQQAFEAGEMQVYSQFWEMDVQVMAKEHGFEIEGAGRSGGWIEITNADPLNLEEEQLEDFLLRYRAFEGWCRSEVKDAPNRVGKAAQDYAVETLLGRTVTAREIVAFEPDFEQGIIELAESMGFAAA